MTHPRFPQPCPYPAEVEVIVRLGRVRRLTTAQFSGHTDLSVDLTLTSHLTSQPLDVSVCLQQSGVAVVTGEAKCVLTRQQLEQ